MVTFLTNELRTECPYSGMIREDLREGCAKRVQDVIKPKMCMIQSCGEAPWVLPAPVGGKKYAVNHVYVGERDTTPVSRTI